jgi:hypothetical protein
MYNSKFSTTSIYVDLNKTVLGFLTRKCWQCLPRNSLKFTAFKFVNKTQWVGVAFIKTTDVITRFWTWSPACFFAVKCLRHILIVTWRLEMRFSTRSATPRMLNVLQFSTIRTIEAWQIVTWSTQVPITVSVK